MEVYVNMKRMLSKLPFMACALAVLATTATKTVEGAEHDMMVHSGNKAVSLKLYGQVNRAALYISDGEEHDVFFVDNSASSTRTGFKGMASISENMTVGAKIEAQIESNSTYAVSQLSQSSGATSFSLRHADIWFQHADLGKLSIGQGSMASNDTGEITLAGTYLVSYSGVSDQAGGMYFREEGTGAITTDANGDPMYQVGSGFYAIGDGGRADRIRYDSPEFAGFTLAVAAAENEMWDLGVMYWGKLFEEFSVGAGIGYAYSHGSATTASTDTFCGSVGMLHDASGFNASFAAGREDNNTAGMDNPNFWFMQIGWMGEMFKAGSTAFALDFYRGKHSWGSGSKGTSIGGGVVQKLDKAGAELYMAMRDYKLDRTAAGGVKYQHLFAVMLGSRVKF